MLTTTAARLDFAIAMPQPVGQELMVLPKAAPPGAAVPSAVQGVRALDAIDKAFTDDKKTVDIRLPLILGAAAAAVVGAGAALVSLAAGAVTLNADLVSFGCCWLMGGATGMVLLYKGHELAEGRVHRRIVQQVMGDVGVAKRAADGGNALTRAWLARRAAEVAKRIPGSLDASDVRWPVEALAENGASTAPEVEALEAVHRFLADDRAVIDAEAERLIASCERLGPEARGLVRDALDSMATAQLGTDAGNRWRLTRLRQVLAGEAAPYTNATVEVDERTLRVDDVLRWRNGDEKKAVHATAEDAVRVLMAMIVTGGMPARVALSDSEAAERVAAYFEGKGSRAAIYQRENEVLVTVYAKAEPPSGDFVKGRA